MKVVEGVSPGAAVVYDAAYEAALKQNMETPGAQRDPRRSSLSEAEYLAEVRAASRSAEARYNRSFRGVLVRTRAEDKRALRRIEQRIEEAA